MRALIVIPTFNERGNVEVLVERIFRLGLPLEVVFVDDASPDGTGEVLDRLAAGNASLHVLHRSGRRRFGTACLAGFAYALRLAPDFILTMDADLSHDPAVIPALLAAAGKCDLAIGSRYTPGGRTTDFRFHRLLLSRCANRLTRSLLGLATRDCTSGFRCYRAQLLRDIPLDRVFSDGYSFLIELLYRARGLGAAVGEVPINFTDRAEGVSKISKAEIFRSLYTVLRLGFCRLTGRTGLRAAGPAALAFFLLLSAPPAPASTPGAGASAVPDHLALNWSGSPATTMTVSWRSGPGTGDGYVQFSRGPALRAGAELVKAARSDFNTDLGPVRLFTARLKGLVPGSKYSYRAGAAGRWSAVHTFTTAGTGAFKFLVFGDSQGAAGGDDPYGVWRDTVRSAFNANPDARFFVNVGDLVDEEGRAAHWNAWFGAAEGVVDTIPAMPAHGNHEVHSPAGNTKPSYWLASFALPENGPAGLKEEVYSYDYGPVHLVVLDSQGYEEKKYGDILAAQRDWLKADLAASRAPWKLVFFHKPVYEQIDGRANPDVKAAFAQVMEQAHVDVVFNAHDHAVARTYPISGGRYMRRPSQGTIYYMTGRSGERPHEGLASQAWDSFFYDPQGSPCYLVVRADRKALRITVADQNGETIDDFFIDKARDVSSDSALPLPAD